MISLTAGPNAAVIILLRAEAASVLHLLPPDLLAITITPSC